MNIGVMSDTHGNRTLMHDVAERMEREFGAGLLFHLGDDYADAEELRIYGHDVRMVPGLGCPEYQQSGGGAPKRLVEEVDGLTFALAHADQDLTAREWACSVIMTGHTHVAVIEDLGMSIRLNPGHLKRPRDRGQDASFATIVTSPEEVVCRIHEADGQLRQERRFPRERLA